MLKVFESPALRLVARAKVAIAMVARGFGALVTEHSRALLAATNAALPRTRLTDLRAMYTSQDRGTDPDFITTHVINDRTAENRAVNTSTAAIQGQLLRVSERREVAIYLRKDALWVADFIDGNGALIDAATWFRFNCGTPATSYARRRMVHESAVPLSMQLVTRIERLHRSVAANASREDRAECSVHEY
jgi:hypothetical protein